MDKSPDQFPLLKSHIDAYTKKDGTAVKAHETRIEAHGVKGMKSTPWRKEFKSHKHLDDWMTKQDGDAELHGVREVEQSAPVADPDNLQSAAAERPQFSEGDSVKVTGNVQGAGKKGVIHETAPSGHFHIVKHADGSKSSYHESDLSAHEADEDGDDDDRPGMLKSHIDQYNRSDGTVVQAHDDKRQAAQPKPAPVVKQHQQYGSADEQIGEHHYGLEQSGFKKVKSTHANPDDIRSSRTDHFEHADGRKATTTIGRSKKYQGMYETSLEHGGDAGKSATAAESKAPPISTHANTLRESSKPGDLDHEDNQIAAGHMEKGDHKALAGHIKHLDTEARDHILDHVHPDHREGLGFKQLDMDRSKKQYAEEFPAKASNAGGPADGEVGHEEHQKYGKYFKKGDKVKDGSGNQHTVVSHRGPEVKTESGQSFHPTKLDHA